MFAKALIDQFNVIFEEAKKATAFDATAVTLSTVSADGQPRGRTVLLKKVAESGFMIVTNRQSVKGAHLSGNPQCSLCFYWPEVGKQVLVEGKAVEATDQESDEYWASRPRESQIGGWASNQSSVISSREELDSAVKHYTNKFEGEDIPRPPHWGGYWIAPSLIEFWTSVPGRLHEREQHFLQPDGVWSVSILCP